MDTPTPITRHYGWKRPLEAPHPSTSYKLKHNVRLDLPSSVDLRPHDTPIENQGQLGSCTSFGWAAAVRYRDHNKVAPAASVSWFDQILIDLGLKKKPTPPAPTDYALSHLFIYYNERVIDGTVNQDAGAAVADGAKVVSTLGTPPESDWPYDINQFATKPPQQAYDDAAKHVVPAPSSVDNTNLNEVKTALANGHPVVYGFTVAQSFENVGADGIYTGRGWNVGGHCVCAVGYDDSKQAIITRNSWGTEFGQGGYFFMPYSIFTNPNITSDAWTIAG
jgi:C1A family cysteine protease